MINKGQTPDVIEDSKGQNDEPIEKNTSDISNSDLDNDLEFDIEVPTRLTKEEAAKIACSLENKGACEMCQS